MKIRKSTLKLCLGCAERRSRFCSRGRVKRDADHDLCFRCFRSVMDSAINNAGIQQRAKRPRAAVGDLVQYRFKRGAFASRTVKEVIEVRDDGDLVVEGGWWVPASDVLTVIPMHRAAPADEGVL